MVAEGREARHEEGGGVRRTWRVGTMVVEGARAGRHFQRDVTS